MTQNTEETDFPAMLGENLWVLGNYYFNLYLVRGSRSAALIEVGISAITDTVISQLESLDISPEYLVVTHPHSDHLTGLEGLRERFPSGVSVFGQGAKEFATHPKALIAMTKEDRHMAKMLSEKGISPGRSPVEGFRFPDEHIVVRDKHEIDLGGVVLRCVRVKGHSPGNIIVHISDSNALILSDSMGFHFPGRYFLPLFFTSFSDHMATLDYMESLRPAILGLGHQGPLTGQNAEKAFEASREASLNLHSSVTHDLRDRDEIAEDIFNRFYKDEFRLYSRKNIGNCARLLVRRCLETPDFQI